MAVSGRVCRLVQKIFRLRSIVIVRGHVALGSGSCAGGAEAVVMCGCVGQSLYISARDI